MHELRLDHDAQRDVLSLRELRQHERLLMTSDGVLTWLADLLVAGEAEKGDGNRGSLLG